MSALNCTSLTAVLDQVANGISTEEETSANRLSAEIHPVINILFNSTTMLYLLIKSKNVHLNICIFLSHANFIDS